jgi:hypothetical protein
MQFLIGFLTALCLTLITFIVVIVRKFNLRVSELSDNFDGTAAMVGDRVVKIMKIVLELQRTVANLPPTVQNVIHLGLKDGQVTTGLAPATLSIRPEDFQIRADKLREKLLHGFETEKHPDTGTLAYCILDHAGVDEMLDGKSWTEAKEALTRLLSNGDMDATKRFLETLADSVANATALPIAESKPKTGTKIDQFGDLI